MTIEEVNKMLSENDGNLYLIHRPDITSLPDNLHVPGNMELCGCPNLKSLPKNLTVDGSFLMHGCEQIKELPDSLNADWFYCEGREVALQERSA